MTPTPRQANALPNPLQPACAGMEILIPLYSYPNWYEPSTYIWDDIAAANAQVPITAIINPNNGPQGCPPNADYQQGLDELGTAGVRLLGYVYTSYAGRDLAAVKADVDQYDQCYDLDGIFFDETSSGGDDLAYYTDLYAYVKSKPNLDAVILNPGTQTDEAYLSTPAGDTSVVFESQSEDWASYTPDPYLSSYDPQRFAMLAYDLSDGAAACSQIELAMERGIGYVYLTDDALPNPWDSLPAFWNDQLNCLAQLNTCGSWLPLIFNQSTNLSHP